MLKLKFHPAFWAFAFVLVWQGKYAHLLCTVVSAVLHEAGHARAAYNRGYALKNITVMPYGAVLYGAENIAKEDAFHIAVAGPMVNIMLAVITAAVWWLAPPLHSYTKVFCNVNLAIAGFNLLPLYPLDGGRILLAFSKNSLKTLKKLRLFGMIFSFIIMALFIASAFFKINYSLGLMSVMLFISSVSGTEKESYRHIAGLTPYVKSVEHPISEKTFTVNHNLPLIKLLRQIKSNHILTFRVVNDDFKTVRVLSEDDVCGLCSEHDIRKKLRDVLGD